MASNNEIAQHTEENSIVVYRPEDNAIQLDVQLSGETVWLTQQQIAQLFQKDQSVIARHINNIFKEGELEKSNMQILHNTTFKYRPTAVYNLDVIISVGYRVKSKRGIQFRQWANRVLRDYLLRGYAVNPHMRYMEQRIDAKLQEHTEQIHELQDKVDFFIRTSLPPREGIFVDGQIYDAFEFIERLIKSAQKSILLVDNYVDETVLTMMSEKQSGVKVEIYTKEINNALQLAEKHFNVQYGGLSLHTTQSCHDRFLIIDDQTIYLIGASLKDAGKRLFAFTQMNAGQIATIKERL
ncbi:MAG: virulence RhuM family protein [Paludibacteraceae bacterium]|nr:virulence RhuM family protein [Paludibacteraceae bacterium]